MDGRLHIINTVLRTERVGQYSVGHNIIPKEEDIISVYLDEDKLWALISSPVINPVDNKPNRFYLC